MAALAEKIEAIQRKAGIKQRDIAQLLGSSEQTVSRWNQGKTAPQRSALEKLLTLEWIVNELADLYAPDEASLWLFSRHKLLGGASPAERIQEGRTEDVLALIDQLKSGAYI